LLPIHQQVVHTVSGGGAHRVRFRRLPTCRFGSNLILPRGTAARVDGETGNGLAQTKRTEGFSGVRNRGNPGPLQRGTGRDQNRRGDPLTEAATDLERTDPPTDLDERAVSRATEAPPSCYWATPSLEAGPQRPTLWRLIPGVP